MRRWCTTVALWALVLGGARGVLEYTRRTHVLEFQAGPPSAWSERALVMLQRAAVESLGFGLLALLLGLAACLLRPLLDRRWRPGGAWPVDTRLAADVVRVAAGFCLWIALGAWLAGEALPFLAVPQVLLLDVAGIAGCVALFVVFEQLAARLPGAAAREPLGRAIASATALGLGLAGAWHILRASHDGPLPWAAAAACAPAALVLARLGMGWLCAVMPALAWTASHARLVPRPVAWSLQGLMLVCVLTWAATFDVAPEAHAPAFAAGAATAASPATGAPVPAGPSVVFITIDTLRADALSCYGYGRPTSPALDRIASQGTRFEDLVAAASWTKPSTGTLLTGLYPSRHGALYHGSQLHTPEGTLTLAEAFRAAGFATAGFVSNPNIKAVFDFDRGFDLWFDAPAQDTLTLSSLRDSLFGAVLSELTRYQFNWKYANDCAAMNAHILPWLDAHHDRPFFLYLHYIDPHEPYSPPEPYASDFAQAHGFPLFNERKRLVGRDLYDAEIRFMDDGIAALEERLRRLGLADDTLVLVTSDHGEEFFEHGVLGHGFSLYQEVVRVPLILRGPGVAAGRTVKEPVATRDIPATLLELAGTGITRLGDGASFAQLARPERGTLAPEIHFLESEFGENEDDTRSFVFSGLRDGTYKLVLTERDANDPPGPQGRQALYDLAADPREQHDLMHDPAQRERVKALLERLRAHSLMLQETGFRDVPTLMLSDDIRAGLEALGYF
jgi:arylsulfatase A-like enzyme